MNCSKFNSYDSSPLYHDKENICPNPRFNTALARSKQSKIKESSSMRTDPEFNLFRTININRSSQPNSVCTKSRVQMEAILENFSTKSGSLKNMSERSHKSFLALLGLAFGREDFSVNEAIQKCQEYQISGKHELISLMDEKEPTREWPLPLSNLLLTDLGQLKIMKLCQSIEKEQELTQSELEILQFLVPNLDQTQILDRTTVLENFNEFRSHIDEKCGLVDDLVRAYTLKVQMKVKKVTDKVALIKMEKKLRKYEKLNQGSISFGQFQGSVDIFKLTEEEKLLAFKYFYFLQNQKIVSLVDRKLTVNCSTIILQFLDKDDRPLMKQPVSAMSLYEQENCNTINGLLTDKHYLIQTMDAKDKTIQDLKKQVMMLQLELENQEKIHMKEKERQIELVRARYIEKIEGLQDENKVKDQMIKWYKNELEAVVDQNKRQFIVSNRHKVFYKVIKDTNFRNSVYEEEDSLQRSSFSLTNDDYE